MARNGYFCGWYFKLESRDNTMALIVARHRKGREESASLQIITDENVWNVGFPIEDYSRERKGFRVRLGKCSFTSDGIHLDIHREGFDLEGDIEFGPWTPLGCDIMGPFAYIPFMQCRHSVLSLRHSVDGVITLNGREYDFHNCVGYIEGDRGYSFPSVYIWTQCLFDGGSLMLSVADIPMGLFHFTGIIGFVYKDGRVTRIATYNGARLISMGADYCTVRQGSMEFTARLVHKNAHPLFAPVEGAMSRTIRESASCTAEYKFIPGDRTSAFELTSDKASFEFEWA